MRAHEVLLLAVILGAAAGAVATYAILSQPKSQDQLISEFYEVENAVHVSPHSVRKAMDAGDDKILLVDLRSEEEYNREHIAGAVSIPAYKDPDTSAYGDVDRIVAAFAALPKDKQIVVYCYSMPCMTGRKVGLMLTEHGIYVKHLGIGWNEWRYFWDLWNHEHEWNKTDVMNYIATGSEPGVAKTRPDTVGCGIAGDFGC